MATIFGAVLSAAVATLFWTCLGFALTRRLVPGRLALPFAPAVGFAVHSALALPLFQLLPLPDALWSLGSERSRLFLQLQAALLDPALRLDRAESWQALAEPSDA